MIVHPFLLRHEERIDLGIAQVSGAKGVWGNYLTSRYHVNTMLHARQLLTI